jgi:hypothetical protein
MIGAMTLAHVDHPADPDLAGEDLSGAFREWVIQYSRVPS